MKEMLKSVQRVIFSAFTGVTLNLPFVSLSFSIDHVAKNSTLHEFMRLSRKIPSNREIMNDILREMCALRRQVGYELRYINIDKDNADRNKIHNLTKVAVLLYALRYQYEFKHGESAFKTLSDELVYGECTLEYIGEVLGAFYDELCSVIFPAELMDGFKCENSSTGTPAEGLPENIETFAGYLIDCCDFDKSLDTVFDHLYGDADKPQNKT